MEATAYDVALYRSPCCYVLEYAGQLPYEALCHGLNRTLTEYPQLAGTLQQQPDRRSYVISTSTAGDANRHCYDFTYQQRSTRPKLTTLFDLWKSGVMPSSQRQLSGARATYFQDCDRTLLVFTWDHALMDVDSFLTIASRWLTLTAACCSDTQGAAAEPGLKPEPHTGRLLHYGRPSYQLQADGRASAQQCWPPSQVPGSTGAADAPSTPGSTEAAAAGCRQWLEAHSSPLCVQKDTLSSIEFCKAAWKTLGLAITGRFVVGIIPRGMLEAWKEQAAVSRPLPAGQFYSSNIASAALMASTLYCADQDTYDRRGGLTVHFVVNCRGGRCGMAIPVGSIGNPSIWGARVWVPQPLLASAQGTASPDLMYHLKTQLHQELDNPHGELNQQFAYWEALRGAGLSGKAYHTGPLAQLQGDITMDFLPDVASQLPNIPGTRLRYALFRWACASLPRLFLAAPTLPRESCCNSLSSKCCDDNSSDIDSDTDASLSCTCGSCGVRFEVTLPRGVAARVVPLWQSQGVRELSAAAARDADLMGAGGTVATGLEMLLLPRFLQKALIELFVPLPLLLWAWISCGLMLVLRCLCPSKHKC